MGFRTSLQEEGLDFVLVWIFHQWKAADILAGARVVIVKPVGRQQKWR